MRLPRSARVAALTLSAIAGCALPGFGPAHLQAARDQAVPSGGERRLEVLVLEVTNCNVCGLVKQNIHPIYERTPYARHIPMRFIDVSRIDETKLGLNGRIDTVPTTVLMLNGREVDRIPGYLAPENFLHILSRLIDNAE